MTIGAGKRRHHMVIKKKSSSDFDEGGQTLVLPPDDVATVWASIEPLRGQEALLARQLDATLSHRITIPWSSDIATIDPSHFIDFGDRRFHISEVRNIREENREMEIIAGEQVK